MYKTTFTIDQEARKSYEYLIRQQGIDPAVYEEIGVSADEFIFAHAHSSVIRHMWDTQRMSSLDVIFLVNDLDISPLLKLDVMRVCVQFMTDNKRTRRETIRISNAQELSDVLDKIFK